MHHHGEAATATVCVKLDVPLGGHGEAATVTDYVWLARPEAPPGLPPWRLVPLVLGIGLGGHAATQALNAAEPLLHEEGLSPMLFSVLTIGPHFASCLLPTLWGDCFVRSARLALVLAPALLFFGQLVLALGMLRHTHLKAPENGPLLYALMAVGFSAYSASRAGLAVVQYAALARLLRTSSLVGALCSVVVTTHAVGAIVQLGSPLLLLRGGLFALQLALLVPAAIGLVSDIA